MRAKIFFAISLFVVSCPLITSAITLADLELQFRFISAQLKTLQSQAGAAAVAVGKLESKPECPVIIHVLKDGDTDATTNGEVSVLQKYLVLKGEIPANTFSEMPKGVFGHLTETALESWQTQHNLLATGQTDAVTRTRIASCLDTDVPAPEITLAADKENIAAGEAVTISWNAKHATRCTMQQAPEGGTVTESAIAITGSQEMHPYVSTAIRVMCANDVGVETQGPESGASVSIVVKEALSAEKVQGMMQVASVLAALEEVLRGMLGQ